MSGAAPYPEPQPSQALLGAYRPPPPGTTNLADVLERVLDKGMVIAGDITINLLDVQLLTIKIRLLIASVDKAREMGIDWWERDERLSGPPSLDGQEPDESLEERVLRLEQKTGVGEQGHAVERE